MKLNARGVICVCLLLALQTATATETVPANAVKNSAPENTASTPQFTIRFATANPAGSHYVVHLMKFKELAERYSDQRLRIEPMIDGAYGSEHDNVMGTAEGDIQMTTVAVNNLTPFAPRVGFLTLPYLFESSDQARRLFRHPIMAELNDKITRSAGVRALGWLIGGYRVLTNNRRPVARPEDLAGLNIRTPMNPIMVATFRAWGVEPLPIAWTETYAALASGVADGQENPHVTYSSMPRASGEIYQVQKYITDIRYILWTGPHLINESFYQQLPADLRRVLQRAADEASLYQWQWTETRNRRQLALLQRNGMVLTAPADQEREWRTRAITVWPDFYPAIGGRAFVDRVLKIIDR